MNVFEEIKTLLDERKGNDVEVTMTSSFEELGIDSLDTVDLLMSLEETFGVEIEMSEDLKTVADVVKIIESGK